MNIVNQKKINSRAFTLIEFAMVILIAGLLYGMVSPAIIYHIEKANVEVTEQSVQTIAEDIDDFFKKTGSYPDSLEEVFGAVPLDAWGNPYQYLRIHGGKVKGKGKLRKDKNLVPINSDYDLYSKGADGKSTTPLTAKISHDDIVRANNGAFFGLATDY